jgi:hypothetical protein
MSRPAKEPLFDAGAGPQNRTWIIRDYQLGEKTPQAVYPLRYSKVAIEKPLLNRGLK